MGEGPRQKTRAHRLISIILVASAMLAGATARADQITASKEPRARGPLSLSGSSCRKDEVKHEGKVIARVESCLMLYEFDNTMESDLLRTYGVGWVQTTVNGVNGWCATRVDSALILPDTVTRHSSAPRRKIQPTKRSRTTVKITTDADGHAVEDASLRQSFTIFPKTWAPSLSDDGKKLTTTWKGRKSATLAFVVGAEISWETLATPTLRGGLGKMSFVESKDC